MFARIILSVFSVGLITIAAAQTGNLKPKKEVYLRTNPFSFIEEDAGILLGVGVQFNSKWSAVFDPQILLYELYQTTGNWSNISGLKLRTEVRYHFYPKVQLKGVYVAPELHLKYKNSRQNAEFGINCQGEMCDYYTLAEYTEVSREIGGAIKFGSFRTFRNPRWAIEYYIGVGAKYKTLEYKDIPEGGAFVTPPAMSPWIVSDDTDESIWTANIPMGLKLSFRISPGRSDRN